MPNPAGAAEVLDREFLEIRARILQLAAALDRIERATGSAADDPRVAAMCRALAQLSTAGANRAEQVQLIFSRPYQESWRRDLGVGQP